MGLKRTKITRRMKRTIKRILRAIISDSVWDTSLPSFGWRVNRLYRRGAGNFSRDGTYPIFPWDDRPVARRNRAPSTLKAMGSIHCDAVKNFRDESLVLHAKLLCFLLQMVQIALIDAKV